MRKKYENGYWDKINYWADMLKEASDKGDVKLIEKSIARVDYFVKRQKEVYG